MAKGARDKRKAMTNKAMHDSAQEKKRPKLKGKKRKNS